MLANDWDNDELIEWGLDMSFINDIRVTPDAETSLAEKEDIYRNNTIKQIVLYYPTDEYELVLNSLDKIGNILDADDNSVTVQKLIQFYNDHKKV